MTIVENVARLFVSLVLVVGAGYGMLALAAAWTGARILGAVLGSFAVRRYLSTAPVHEWEATRAMLRKAPEFTATIARHTEWRVRIVRRRGSS